MNAESIIKMGGVISTVGVGLFIAFVFVLVIFPVIKSCDDSGAICSYTSTAPAPFNSMVQPTYLAISLLVIAGGVLMVRLGRWRDAKNDLNPAR